MFRTLICGVGDGMVVQVGSCDAGAPWSLKSARSQLESFQTKAATLDAIEKSGLRSWYGLAKYVAKRRGEASGGVKTDETFYRMVTFGVPRISKLLATGNSRTQAAFRILCDDFPDIQLALNRAQLWSLLHPMPMNAYDLRLIEEWSYRLSREKRPAVSPNPFEEFYRCRCLSYGMTNEAYPYLYRLLVELRSAELEANLLRYACALHALLDAPWPTNGVLERAVRSDIKTYLIRTFGFIKLELRHQAPLSTARYLSSLQLKLVPIPEEPKSSVVRDAGYRLVFDLRPPSNCRRTRFVN